MIVCIDFDSTIVRQDQPYNDTTSPLQFMPGARPALAALKAAGHALVLWSSRANLALRENPELDPLVRAGVRKFNPRHWKASVEINRKRYDQMVEFVARELPGIFDAIDDGRCGKFAADLYIDDRALTFGHRLAGLDWSEIAHIYGEQPVLDRPSVFKEK